MQFTFIDFAGATLFVRDDAERAEWTQEEMTLNADFPFDENKVISICQRVCFSDPSTGSQQVYEVKQAKTLEPDGVQQIIAENICISELTDEHMDEYEVTDKSCSEALSAVLAGTLWSVGSVAVNPTSSADIGRGSVWQAISSIKSNWNVYIEPRVTLSSTGTISRKLDIKSVAGEWNGLRLSIDKNLLDPAVTYDDSDLYTALWGYGGSDDDGETVDFSSIVWQPTSTHPGKPYGQKYLEDKEKTAKYGRNGRARFGYYQNSDITDPETLLRKTWETLSTISEPTISIDGTIEDLHRMGYVDTPVKLHDIALVEVLPAGFQKQIQIISITTDLLNPASTTVTIGDYIPNIVYINRDTNDSATGSSGGSGGNTNDDTNQWQEFRTTINKLANDTGLEIKAVKNDISNQQEEIWKQQGRLEVAYNKIEAEVTDRTKADDVLSGRITVQSNKISLVVKETQDGNFVVNSASIVLGINRQEGSYIKIQADKINLTGYVTADQLAATNATIQNLMSVNSTAGYLKATSIVGGYLTANYSLTVDHHTCSFKTITIDGTTYHLLGY